MQKDNNTSKIIQNGWYYESNILNPIYLQCITVLYFKFNSYVHLKRVFIYITPRLRESADDMCSSDLKVKLTKYKIINAMLCKLLEYIIFTWI